MHVDNNCLQIICLKGDTSKASSIKRKNYSQDQSKIAEFHCFYIEEWNSFVPIRQFKIGCFTREGAEKLIKAIDMNTRTPDENCV